MGIQFLKRSFFQRLLGKPATQKPGTDSSWNYADGKLAIELSRVFQLKIPGGAVRFEGKNLPRRVLVVCGEEASIAPFTTGAPIWAIDGWTRFPGPTRFNAAALTSPPMI